MNENFDEFDKYVLRYDLSVRMIEYKYKHSYRVVHQAEEICRSINLDTVERDLASNIALLHDIARFRQWTEYETFNDQKSFDHGDEGVKILFEEGEIHNYNIDEADYDIVKTAIANHNKYAVDYNKLSARETLHTKIIRDADKVDVLYALSTNKLLSISDDDSEISEDARDEFFDHKQVTRKITSSQNDRILCIISFIFDLNYDYSKARVYNEKYLDKIYKNVKNKEIYKPFIDEAKKYLKGEIKDVR